jgi:hypothetical protein
MFAADLAASLELFPTVGFQIITETRSTEDSPSAEEQAV